MTSHSTTAEAGEELFFTSDDIAATEDFLSRTYTKMVIGGAGASTHTRITRHRLGRSTVDDVTFGYDMAYDAGPLGRVCLCRVRSGHIEVSGSGGGPTVLNPGDVALISPPELPYTGTVRSASYELVMFDDDELSRVVDSAPGMADGPVRLLGNRPVSAAAHQSLAAAFEYVRALAGADAPRITPLVSATAISHLAAVVLETLPNTALGQPTAADRVADSPAVMRRAKEFVDANAHLDIALADIAAAVHITPRALQYAFRRHLDMSPMEYLRRVRLDHAHRQLLSAEPHTATVRGVAAQWGFAHTGRFSALYRRTYGRSPSETLRL